MIRIFLFLTLFFYTDLHARQVQGRSTLPSDCTKLEVWVRDHGKVTGNWSAYCRIRRGQISSKAYHYIAPKFKAGLPKEWVFPEERLSDWHSKDVATILWAIEKIPEQLWSEQLKGIYRMSRSMDFPNPGMYMAGHIVLYDSAFQNEEYTARVLAHELSHARFRNFSEALRLEYQKKTGWKNKDRKYLSEDCEESIDEDFAKTVELYIFEPLSLKKVNESAYGWVENFLRNRRKK